MTLTDLDAVQSPRSQNRAYTLEALVSPRAHTKQFLSSKSPGGSATYRSQQLSAGSFRSWGWHDRNAAAVKAYLDFELDESDLLEWKQAASRQMAARSKELTDSSARAFAKVKKSAAMVAEARAAAEHDARKEREKLEAVRELALKRHFEVQAQEAAIRDHMEAIRWPPRRNPHHLRRETALAAYAEVQRQSLRQWTCAQRCRAEAEEVAREEMERAAEEASRLAQLSEDLASAREIAVQRGRGMHLKTAAKASESNRMADSKAHYWFHQLAEEDQRKEETRLKNLSDISEATKRRKANLRERVESLAERASDAADAAEGRRDKMNALERQVHREELKMIHAEFARLTAEAYAANLRPPDNSYCSVEEYLAKLNADTRRYVWKEFSQEDRDRAHQSPPPTPEPEPEPVQQSAPTRWVPATRALRLGLELEREQSILRKNESAFMLQRKGGVGSRT